MSASSERFPPVDFEGFHRRPLQALLAAGNGRLAACAARSAHAIAFVSESGAAYTYTVRDDAVVVEPGADDAATVVRITAAQWSDFVNELRTIPNLVYAGQLDLVRGETDHVLAWELPLLALFHGRPVFDAASARPLDASGQPLDLHASFSLDEPDERIANFLRRAGYVHVRGVLRPEEIETLRGAADDVALRAQPGDRRSWWAHDAAGEQLLCRVTYANQSSAPIAALSDDPRLQRLGGLLGPGTVDAPDRMDGHTVILKNPGARDGLSDLPWHIDCGMGGHSFLCPIVQLSVFLERADTATGTLSVIPGSHRFATPMPSPHEEAAFNAVDLVAEPGDVVVHLGDTMHAAKAPTGQGPFRRSIVMSFFQRPMLDIVAPGEALNDVLLGRNDGHVEHI
jgi:hypothetical protein